MPARPLARRRVLPRVAAVVAALTLVAACATDSTGTDDATQDAATSDATQDATTSDEAGLSVAVASFDLAVGDDQRLLAGLYTADAGLLTYGDVDFELAYLGEDPSEAAEISQEVTASYLAVPGWEPEGDNDRPVLDVTDGRGLYAAQADLDQAGYWGLRVVAELDDGRELEGRTVFTVAEETQVPDVGDEAPRTANHTLQDAEEGLVEPVAVDSRAQDGAPIPDRQLHDTRISDAIDAGRPVVVIVSTPVYCRTNFCGPLVETLAATAEEHGDRAEFVHLEIYEDFDAQQLNDAAAAWIQPADGSDGGEPWVFLVGADGTITARWDNVLDLAELRGLLDDLPASTPLRDTEDQA